MALDPQAQQNVNDFQSYVKDTLMSISAKFSEAMSDAVEDAFDNLDKKVISSVEKDLTKTFKNLVKSSDDISLNIYKLKQGLIGAKDLAKQQSNIDEKRILLEARIAHAKLMGAKFDSEDLARAKEALDYQDEELKKAIEFNKLIEKRLGITGKLVGSLAKIPGIGQFIKADELETSLRSAAANGAGQFKIMGLAAKNAFGQITKGLTDPLFLITAQITLFKKIFDINKDINERQVAQQRSLGISYDQSQKLAQSTFEYANATNDVFVTEKRLTEGRTKLNNLLGTSIVYTNQSVEGFERLTHYYGVSEESAAKLTELATQQGTSTKDILGSTIKVANEQKRQFGGTISYQKVLQKVSSTGGEILTKFKGNTQELAKAVMQADRLGLNLEQVNKIGESLLDFESSIENELKAELLTGKQINLERARAAALSGDLATLTNEIAKQTGGIAQFQKMNAIQQKAYAEAFGMTTAEMGDMLRKRELEAKLGVDIQKDAEKALKLADERGIKIDESIRKDLEAKTLADKQKYVFEKIAEIIGRITSGPMGKFLKLIESALSGVEKIFSFFGRMTGGVLGDALGAAIIGIPTLLLGVRALAGGIKSMISGRGGSFGNPWWIRDRDAAGGGGGGFLDDMFGGDGTGKKGKGRYRDPKTGRFAKKPGGFGRFGKFGKFAKGLGGFGIGTAIGIGTDLIADQMEEGTGKDVVSGISTTASYAGTGAMIGSIIPGVGTAIGAGVGAIAGAITSLFNAESNRREREEKAKQQREEQQQKTNELLSQFINRPVQLNVGGKTILDFNTASNLYGNQQSSF
jgi:hypothetical protein